jgi:hypothetical protein
LSSEELLRSRVLHALLQALCPGLLLDLRALHLLPEALPQGSDLPSEELLRRRVLHALLPAVCSGRVLPEGLCSGHVLPEGLCPGHVLLAL